MELNHGIPAMGELTEYEQFRTPQEIRYDSTELTISPRSLYREIICPICLDILSHTRAAPECLHRFCKKCVEKSIKKECPVCGKKLPSQVKSFREDVKFDQLITKIFNGLKTQPIESNRLKTTNECEVVLKEINGQQIRYLKCPNETSVEHLSKYLSMRPDGAKMPENTKNEQYILCIEVNRATGQYDPLPSHLKLENVRETYKFSDRPLEIYFYNP